MWPDASARPPRVSDTYWQSLHYFNLYRLIVAGVILLAHLLLGEQILIGRYHPTLFVAASLLYILFGGVLMVTTHNRWPRFELQLSVQVLADVVLIAVLMFASGGMASGLGLMLLITLAASSLVAQGRLAMFHAAVATLALLTEQTVWSWKSDGSAEYFQTALLSVSFFAVAGLAQYLGKRLYLTEELARQRGLDLANLDLVNQLVIQDMQDGVIVVDGEGHVRQVNPQAERILGPLPGPRGAVTLTRYAPEVARHFGTWRESSDIDLLPLRAAKTRPFRVRFVPVRGDKRLGAVIFLEDMSRAQAQAQQLKLAALGRLTANIAHEIRNPLSAIAHATQLLQEDGEHDATARRLLDIIRDNTFRLDRMVQDILQLNRKDRSNPEPIALAPYLAGFADEFAQVEKIPRETFSVECEPELKLAFDRYHLHQILWNLCRNAWRHGLKRAGSIRLVGSRGLHAGVVQLDVIDDGPGVPPADQAHLFEPFFTTESTGTGLGLYIARQLAEANQASLDYIELAPGGQFRICGKEEPW
ncbi:sensor histidine kinase [Thiobacter aerophilum]|uniref:histidine kinase n=1 Tax=Thiobacter aerophilum TaxID=3121275 RepID=A0ABV0EJ62_9BURK